MSHGISCYGKGLLEESEKHLPKGIEFCERINFYSWNGCARHHLGEIHFEAGDFSAQKTITKKQVGF